MGDLNGLLTKRRNNNIAPVSEEDYAVALSWPVRVAIACDIAHGLAYLHSMTPHPIVHR